MTYYIWMRFYRMPVFVIGQSRKGRFHANFNRPDRQVVIISCHGYFDILSSDDCFET